MDIAADPVRYTLSQPSETPPGEVFNYSGGGAIIISRLLRKATGQPIDALARTELFEPLGSRIFEWPPIASDEPAAASGLRLRPRDTAKLGQLVLDHGAWRGQQVVPADWIAAATTPQIGAPLLWFYGYQFWLGRSLVHGREVDWVAWTGLRRAAAVHRAGVRPGRVGACRTVPQFTARCRAAGGTEPLCAAGGEGQLTEVVSFAAVTVMGFAAMERAAANAGSVFSISDAFTDTWRQICVGGSHRPREVSAAEPHHPRQRRNAGVARRRLTSCRPSVWVPRKE